MHFLCYWSRPLLLNEDFERVCDWMMFSLDGESHFLPVIVNYSIDFFPDKRLKKLPEPWHLSIMRESRGVSNVSSFVRFPSHSGCPKRVFAGLWFDQEQREHTWTKVFTSVGCLSRHSVIIKKTKQKNTHSLRLSPEKKRQYSAFQSSYLVCTNLGS